MATVATVECHHRKAKWQQDAVIDINSRSERLASDLTLECCLQQNHFEGKLAGVVADAVVEHLIATKELPESCRVRDTVDMSRVMLSRPGNLKVVGRADEMQRVMEALTGDAGAAVLLGGPGEGKSTVAMEVGLELCTRGWFPGGAFVIDFLGAYELSWCCLHLCTSVHPSGTCVVPRMPVFMLLQRVQSMLCHLVALQALGWHPMSAN
jgi:hypothetical protein